jgi:hypothetical protein
MQIAQMSIAIKNILIEPVFFDDFKPFIEVVTNFFSGKDEAVFCRLK